MNATREMVTSGGITITATSTPIEPDEVIADLIDRLDAARGVLLSSSYEYPGRYTRWDMGFVDPPLVLTSSGDRVVVEALNERGEVLLEPVASALNGVPGVVDFERSAGRIDLRREG